MVVDYCGAKINIFSCYEIDRCCLRMLNIVDPFNQLQLFNNIQLLKNSTLDPLNSQPRKCHMKILFDLIHIKLLSPACCL